MSLFTSVVRDYCGNERKLVTADAASMYMYTHARLFFASRNKINWDWPSLSVLFSLSRAVAQAHLWCSVVSKYNITQINRFSSNAHNSISMLFTSSTPHGSDESRETISEPSLFCVAIVVSLRWELLRSTTFSSLAGTRCHTLFLSDCNSVSVGGRHLFLEPN